MAKLLIQSLGCPNCGAPYESGTRNCKFCGSVLILTSVAEVFGRSLDPLQVSESMTKWRQVLKEDPENANAHFALGLTYLNSKLRDAALEHLRKAVLLAPEVADTHHNLALTLFNDGNILLASSEYAEAVKEIDYSIRLAPDFRESLAFKHFFLARKLDKVDNVQAAAEYRKAVEACPDIATLWNNLGMCFLNLKNYTEAENYFKYAIKLDKDYSLAYSNLSLLMYNQKKYSEGVELGIKAVTMMGPATLEIYQALAHNNLAICLSKLHRKSEALEHIKKAIALNPNNPLFQQNLKTIQGNDCYVVTATMGDHFHPWVIELSAFRDQVLMKSSLGMCLVRFYYYWSPVFARLIASSFILRKLSLVFVVKPALFISRLWSKLF